MLRVRFVGPKHYILASGGPREHAPAPIRLPFGARSLWTDWGLGECNGAVVVTTQNEIVGFFRFNWDAEECHIQACGTWVSLTHRGTGLARRMWRRVLRAFPIATIRAVGVSPGGKALIRSLRAEFPHLKWKLR